MTWYLKQLFPLTYWTQVGRQDGSHEFVIWRMWLGRCFNVARFGITS